MVVSWSSAFLSLQCARRKRRNSTRPHTLPVTINSSKDIVIHSSRPGISGGFVVVSPSGYTQEFTHAYIFELGNPVENIAVN